MSDMFRPENEPQNPDTENLLTTQGEQAVPHAGNLPEGQGQDLPVREFKDTPLHYAHAEGLLDPLPDDAGALAETQAKTTRRWLKPVAAVALVGSAFAGGMLVSGGGEDNERPVAADSPVIEEEVETTPTTEAEVTPTTEVAETPEIAETFGREAVLMDADTPEKLLEQLVSNFYCTFDANPLRIQEECLSYIIGDRTGELSTNYYNLMLEYNDYRIDNPDFEYNYSAEIIDALVEDLRMVIVAEVTDAASSYAERFTFVKTPVAVIQPSVEDETQQVWILQKSETLNPGEVSFD